MVTAPPPPPTATIEVVTSYSPLTFLYGLFKPNVRIDGQMFRPAWGTVMFPVLPGLHVVEISYHWIFMSECGLNRVHVAVNAGDFKRVRYRARLIRYLPGKIGVEDALPEARLLRG